jgi:hypothetical protein
MGSSSKSSTSQTTYNTDNRKAASDKSIIAEGGSTVTATYNDVSADVVKGALSEANKAFGTAGDLAEKALDSSNRAFDTAGDLARAAVNSSSEAAKAALDYSRATANDLIRSQDASLQAAERLYSAAASGGATTANETAGSIAKLAVVGAGAAVIILRK